VAMMLGTSCPPLRVLLKDRSPVAALANSDPVAIQDDSERFRQDLHRRYETPFQNSWDHAGINE
jgi:hypothetical protein